MQFLTHLGNATYNLSCRGNSVVANQEEGAGNQRRFAILSIFLAQLPPAPSFRGGQKVLVGRFK